MAVAWDDVGNASNILQVLGVDAFGLASMITQAALTARRNRDACLLLAEHVRVVEGLLRRLQTLSRLRQYPETRRPLEQLDDTLRRAYLLVRSCGHDLAARGYLYRVLTGHQTAAKLRAAQKEIDWYIKLVPVIDLVATDQGRAEEAHVHEVDGEDSASAHRDDDGGSRLIVDGEVKLRQEDAPVRLHEDDLPHPPQEHPSSPVTVLAGNFRKLTILQDGAEASSSSDQSEARGSSIRCAKKIRRDDKKQQQQHWRIYRVSPRPIISKTKRRKDIVCYVCVVPQHVASRRCFVNKGKGPFDKDDIQGTSTCVTKALSKH